MSNESGTVLCGSLATMETGVAQGRDAAERKTKADERTRTAELHGNFNFAFLVFHFSVARPVGSVLLTGSLPA